MPPSAVTRAGAFLIRRVVSRRRCTTAFLGDTGFCTRPLVGLCLLVLCAGLPVGPTPNEPPLASCLGAAGLWAGAAADCCLGSLLACAGAAAAAVLPAPMLPLLLRLAGWLVRCAKMWRQQGCCLGPPGCQLSLQLQTQTGVNRRQQSSLNQ